MGMLLDILAIGENPMARVPKSVAQHKIDGTFRRDRHGDRMETRFEPGLPEKPETLTGDASRLWDTVVSGLPDGALCHVDWAALSVACSAFAFARRFREQLERDPLNTKLMRCWVKAESLFLTLSSRFGLTPADRSKLALSNPPAPTYDDPLTVLKAITATPKNDR